MWVLPLVRCVCGGGVSCRRQLGLLAICVLESKYNYVLFFELFNLAYHLNVQNFKL